MNSFWVVHGEVLDSHTCDEILNISKDIKQEKGLIGDKAKTDYRDSLVVGVPHGTSFNRIISNILDNIVYTLNDTCFGFNLGHIKEYQIAEYKDHGHYKLHNDMRISQETCSMRKLSVSVQLSDPKDYKGGNLEFADFIGTPEQKYLRPKGTVIVFPSFIPHQITPVTEGVRHSLVGWYEGLHWT